MAGLVLATLLSTSPSGAADELSFRQYRHTAWTGEDGGPTIVNRILQTRDGYLWTASSDGLTRFDGVRFDSFSPSDHDPMAPSAAWTLLQRRSGELWVGFGGPGSVAIFRDGRFIDTGMPNPSRGVIAMAEDLDGAVWVVNGRPVNSLSRYRAGRWDAPGQAMGMPEGWIFSALVGRDGTLWLGMTDRVVFLRRGGKRFEMTPARVQDGGGLAEDPHGNIWLADRLGTRRLPDYVNGQTDARGQPDYPAPAPRRRVRIAFGPNGDLWGATGSAGAFRIAHPDANGVESRISAADGLSDDQVNAVLVDREGTAWIGGQRGLNAFVRPSLVEDEVLPRKALGYYTVEDGRGGVYIQADDALYLVRPGQAPRWVRGGVGTAGLCTSQRGGLWIVDGARAEELVDGRPGRVLALDRDHGFYTCAEDGAGRMWIAAGDATLRVRDARGWKDESPRLEGQYAAVLHLDRQGRVLVADGNLGLRRFDGDSTRVWAPGVLGIGQLIAARDTTGGIVVSGSGGLARVKGDRVERLLGARHPFLRRTRWLLETPEGDIWLFTSNHIVRIAAADWEAAFRDPGADIPHRVFDALDGLTSPSDRLDGPRAARGGDGRLWFLGLGGVMRLDPAALTTNPVEPPVVIRAIKAGGRSVPVSEAIHLPAGASKLQIDYTALSLRAPARVRFRYRLVGVDEAWVEAGARRSAYYNNLEPGRYRFEVIAANEDGVWSSTGAGMNIVIAPRVWQTGWFMALCLLAAGIGSWFLYRLRLRVVAGRIRAGLGQRLAERERIARELHDTLLQGVQGLILRFQLIAEELPRNRPQRRAMEAALDQADTVLGEARDRVQDLRMTDLEAGDLDAALGQLAQSEAGPPPVGVFVEGEARPLERIAFDELFQIVREALVNARRHAAATCIEIRVRYAPGRLTVAVVDDGVGMAPEMLKTGRAGHFGLTGMRERARRISARLRIDSGPGGGTRVEIGLPRRLAYVTASREGGFAGWLGRLWHG